MPQPSPRSRTAAVVLAGFCAFLTIYAPQPLLPLLAREFRLTRAEQDAFALESNRRALAARDKLSSEICPAFFPLKASAVTKDNGPRDNQSREALAKLKPVFDRRTGTVTAGNAPGLNDGASALVVTSLDRARSLGVEPMARIVAQATSGIEPELVMMAPVEAMKKVLKKAGWAPSAARAANTTSAYEVSSISRVRLP